MPPEWSSKNTRDNQSTDTHFIVNHCRNFIYIKGICLTKNKKISNSEFLLPHSLPHRIEKPNNSLKRLTHFGVRQANTGWQVAAVRNATITPYRDEELPLMRYSHDRYCYSAVTVCRDKYRVITINPHTTPDSLRRFCQNRRIPP